MSQTDVIARKWDNGHSPRILIIDDNPDIHQNFDIILLSEARNSELEANEAFLYGTDAGSVVAKPEYRLDHAFSGLEGVEKARQAIAEGAPYQMAFVDIRMPGIDGVETIERIWGFDSHIQTVICTAYADYSWADLSLRLGRTDRLLILKKPFQDIEVMQLARALVEKWFLAKSDALRLEQMELLVAQRTQKLIELQQSEHKRLHELDQTKLRYLINLSQEFRDPLTLILGPLAEMLEKGSVDRQQQELAYNNAKNLLRMVDGALVLRKLELQDLKLNLSERDLVTFLRGILQGFGPQPRVTLDFKSNKESRRALFDTAKFERVLLNVLSYSLESIPGQGRISVMACFKPAVLEVVIEDTGCGIPKEELSSIYNLSNEKMDDSGAKIHSRLRLILAHQLLHLQGGGLQVESPLHAGSCPGTRFTLSLPLAEGAARPTALAPMTEALDETSEEEEKEPPLILVVEDNADLLAYLRQELETQYRVAAAAGSKEGLSESLETVPDLIISDIHLPQLDGLELCSRLKNNEVTSHIPVILLAAIDPEESQLKAMEVGADDCFSKPFRMPLLTARIQNLLESRRKLHEHFKQVPTFEPRDLATNQVDAEFLRETMEVVEAHLADLGFDVDVLAQKVAVSRRQLFRKFKAMMGCTPNVFIRTVRLKRAAQLLKDSDMTVSEIIYAVGFSDPKYFRNVFRGQFEVSPGEYAKQFRPVR